MTYSVLSSESSTARQTLTAAISSTFGVYKSQVQITVTAPAKHRRSLLQDKTALAILQGSRAPMSNVAVTVAGKRADVPCSCLACSNCRIPALKLCRWLLHELHAV